jgi:acyl-CoA synthetase (AMP-forming)/AMP-acid ligase II
MNARANVRTNDLMNTPSFSRTPELPRLADYPAHWARLRPAGEAVVDGGRVRDWVGFERDISQVARALLAAGVQSGDRVAMLAAPCLEHLLLFMAAARVGAIWLGLNPRYRLDELRHVLCDAQPRVVVAMLDIEGRDYRPEFRELQAVRAGPQAAAAWVALASTGEGLQPWEAFVAAGRDVPEATLDRAVQAVEPDDVALIVYTSGSTGVPKGAMLSHRAIVTTARIQCEHWWAEPFRILNNMPINHVGGAVQIACHAIVAGGANLLMPRFDPVALPAFIRERRVSVTHQVATMYQLLLDRGQPSLEQLAPLQVLIWSGAPAPRSLVQALRRFGARLHTSYGQTESGGEVLYTPPQADDEVLSLSVGLPDSRIPLRLGAEDGSGPASGTEGEIQVQGPTLMSGYFGQPEATRAVYTADGWLRTGDIAERRPDGLFRITGRLKEMFKSGGYNVYPREVELVLERHPGVAMAAVVGVPDAVYGEVGHAWVQPSDPALSTAALEAHCRAHLANYKVPKRFHLQDELPMLPIGKVDRVALRRRVTSLEDHP